MGDERILGSSEFVEKVLKKCEEDFEKRLRLQSAGMDLSTLISTVAGYLNIDAKEIKDRVKERRISRARSIVCYLAAHWFMISQIDLAKELGLSPSAVSKAISRGRKDQASEKLKRKLVNQKTR